MTAVKHLGASGLFAVLLAAWVILLSSAQPSFADDPGPKILTADLPPYNYIDKGRLKGPVAILISQMLKTLGHNQSISALPWPRAYAMALKGPDYVLFSIVRSPEREKLFKWVGPVARLDDYLFKKRGSPLIIKSLDDAKRYRVGIQCHSAGHQYLRQMGFKKIEVDYSVGGLRMARMLMAGRIDLWVAPISSVRWMAAKSGVDPQALEPIIPIRKQLLYIGFSRSIPDKEVRRWQAVLDQMKQDGGYDEIFGAESAKFKCRGDR